MIFRPRRLARLSSSVLALLAPLALPAASDVIPAPAELHFTGGRMDITAGFAVALHGHVDSRLKAGMDRALRRWEERTGFTFSRDYAASPDRAVLVIECAEPGAAIPSLTEDESYTLDVSISKATMRAPTVVGVLRGLETLLQLLQADANGWFLPAVGIRDQPRFPWRGLLIDVCRHWQPIEVIKRNLDGMALVKLNVLHFHLSEDQGFRAESRVHPRLHELGSDGNYYTQDQIREIIAYARDRGIRVVPEFDMPGHAMSWVVGYPELASAPGPYELARHWGVFDAVLDPTNEDLYRFLDGFLGEMGALFPDAYFHIGGDENNGRQWSANPRIQAFIREHSLEDNAGLHAYFNRRVQALLAKYGKTMIGWDEILHSNLPADTMIHVWHTPKPLTLAAQQGFSSILSSGFYINHSQPATVAYANDPLPADTILTPEQQRHIKGGEATMWSEWVTPETIDSRIWPRTAAVAERLWSPREVNDIADMYRRLGIVGHRLEEAGLLHEKNRPAMLRRLAGDGASETDLANLRVFCDYLAPTNGNVRYKLQPEAVQSTPLTGLTDCLLSESLPAQAYTEGVTRYLFGPGPRDPATNDVLARRLVDWSAAARGLTGPLAERSPRLRKMAPFVEACLAAAAIGEEALRFLNTRNPQSNSWRDEKLARLAAPPVLPADLSLKKAIRLLVAAAGTEAERSALPPAGWRALVEKMAKTP